MLQMTFPANRIISYTKRPAQAQLYNGTARPDDPTQTTLDDFVDLSQTHKAQQVSEVHDSDTDQDEPTIPLESREELVLTTAFSKLASPSKRQKTFHITSTPDDPSSAVLPSSPLQRMSTLIPATPLRSGKRPTAVVPSSLAHERFHYRAWDVPDTPLSKPAGRKSREPSPCQNDFGLDTPPKTIEEKILYKRQSLLIYEDQYQRTLTERASDRDGLPLMPLHPTFIPTPQSRIRPRQTSGNPQRAAHEHTANLISRVSTPETTVWFEAAEELNDSFQVTDAGDGRPQLIRATTIQDSQGQDLYEPLSPLPYHEAEKLSSPPSSPHTIDLQNSLLNTCLPPNLHSSQLSGMTQDLDSLSQTCRSPPNIPRMTRKRKTTSIGQEQELFGRGGKRQKNFQVREPLTPKHLNVSCIYEEDL